MCEKLAAWDAKWQKLDSHMESENGRLSLAVGDESAKMIGFDAIAPSGKRDIPFQNR